MVYVANREFAVSGADRPSFNEAPITISSIRDPSQTNLTKTKQYIDIYCNLLRYETENIVYFYL